MTRIQPEFFENSLRDIGALFDPNVLDATRQLYRPHLLLEPAGDEQTDVAYGPDDRHRLDVYLPASAARGIAVFVHGGGFVGGNKNIDGTFYPNVGRWLARNGYVGVLPNYRLAPAHPWPAAADDIGGVLDWVGDHRGSLARAGVPVVLWGQSAGAAHVATWLFDPRQRGRTMCDRLAGVMMMSGFYEATAPLHGGPLAYFGADEALYPDRSALTHVVPDGGAAVARRRGTRSALAGGAHLCHGACAQPDRGHGAGISLLPRPQPRVDGAEPRLAAHQCRRRSAQGAERLDGVNVDLSKVCCARALHSSTSTSSPCTRACSSAERMRRA